MEVFILMQVRRTELTNERRTRAWQNCMVQDKRLELLRRRQRDLNPPCLPIPPILRLKVAFRSANHHLTNYFVITGVLSIGKPLAGNLAPVIFVRRAPWCG